MKKNYLFKFSIAVLILFSTVGYSQNCTPINVSGFNFDGVAEATPALNTTTGALDLSNHVMYTQSYGAALGIGYGIANSGQYTSGTSSYQLQPYNQNNMLRLTAGQNGVLNFVTPSSYNKISLLGFNAEQSGPFNYTINFVDGTTVTGSSAFPDWFNVGSVVAYGVGCISRNDNGGTQNATNPKLFSIDINLTGTNAFKKISNISFTATFGGSQGMHIMAISGVSNVQIDPGQCGAVVNYSLPNAGTALPKVLILTSEVGVDNINDIKAKLLSTSSFSAVDAFNTLPNNVPALSYLQEYDAILVYTYFNAPNMAAVGNVLAAYIDGGGGVVDAFASSLSGWEISGVYTDDTYRVMNNTSIFLNAQLILDNVILPSHPIMNGITTFSTSPNGFYYNNVVLAPNAYIIANYNNNVPFIMGKENVGPMHSKRVCLNMFPPSSTVTPSGWDVATDGAKIMANSLKWVADTYTQTNGLASGSLFPVGTTTNTFTYTDNNNVVQTFSFDIIVKDNENPVVSCTANAEVTSCDGTLTFTTPVFSDNCPSSILTQTAGLPSGAVFPVGITTNTFVVTDASGNIATCSFTVTRNADLSSTSSQDDLVCNGAIDGTATVTVSGGKTPYTYLWSNGQTTAEATGLAADTYTVTVTDSNGCELTESFTITEPSVLVTTGTQVDVLCFGLSTGEATVNVTGGTGAYTYRWDTTPVQTSATATGLIAGDYTVTVKDANLCETTQLFTITEPLQPLALTPNTNQINVKCFGDATGSIEVVVNGGTTPYTYLWNDGQITSEATGLVAGDYDVTITDASGCELTESFTITEPNAGLSQILSQVDVKCFGDTTGSATVDVTGGTGAYTYTWSPSGGTAATATGLSAGMYTVTVKDANLCEITQSFTITEPAQPLTLTPNTSQVDVLCNGQATGSATIAVSGGTAPYTYLWYNGATTNTITGLTAGTYTVNVTDANGCMLPNSYTITEPTAITVTGTQVDVLCNGNATGEATVTAAGGTGAYSYSWNTTPVQTTATVTGLTAGSYMVTVYDANQCQATQSFTITEPLQPLSTTPNTTHTNVSCFGGTNGSASIAVTGGTAPYTYLWNNGAATNSISTLAAGTYTVDVTDANGCTLSESFIITEPTALTASAGTVTNVSCFGAANGSAAVNVTGGTGAYAYSWNTTPVQTTATATGLAPGVYTVTVKDANLCETTQSFTITQPDALIAAISAQTDVLCFGAANGTATVTATGGTTAYNYSWNTVPVQTTATVTGLAPGTHTVTVTDANGCHTTASVTISQPASALHLTTSQTNVDCYGNMNGSLGVNVTGGTGSYTYTWTPAVSTTNTATGLGVGNYKVVVTDANGCTDLRYLSVTSPALLTGVINVTNINCGGSSNGTAIVNVSGGTAPYTYAWSNGSTTAALANLAGGTYSVTVTDAHNCTFTVSATVTEPAAIVIASQPIDASVEAGQWAVYSVAVQNATSYQWQVSTNGTTWVNVTNGGASPHYSGAATASLSIANITLGMNGNKYRVILSQQGNCTVVSDDASLTVTAPLAAIEDIRKLSMTIYPNPASTDVYVKIPDFEYFNNLKISMYDLNGRVVRSEQSITSANHHIDITGLESAVYIITITSDSGRIDKKIVVNKTL